jgi:hypothetical protein
MASLEKFDDCVGLILAVLTESFPRRMKFNCDDISAIAPDIEPRFVGDCMGFLRDEGLVEYEDASLNFYFLGCRLTLKGVSCLRWDAPELLKYYDKKDRKNLAKIAIQILNQWITQRR